MTNTWSGHYETLLTTIEGRLEPEATEEEGDQDEYIWVDDLRDWTGSKRYDQIEGSWTLGETYMGHNLHTTVLSGRNTEWTTGYIYLTAYYQ